MFVYCLILLNTNGCHTNEDSNMSNANLERSKVTACMEIQICASMQEICFQNLGQNKAKSSLLSQRYLLEN